MGLIQAITRKEHESLYENMGRSKRKVEPWLSEKVQPGQLIDHAGKN